MRLLLVALGAALAVGCYNPTVPAGAACGPGEACPRGQHCILGACTTSVGGDDAAVEGIPGDADPDALPDAVPDAPPDAPPHASGWFVATPLPSARSLACAVAFDKRLYEIGGSYMTVPKADVLVAPILDDGMIGAWAATTGLPVATRWHDCGVHEPTRTIYVVGGDSGPAGISTVYSTTIANDGSVGPWNLEPPLPAGRRGLRVGVVGDWVYALGGEEADGFVLRSTVFVAAVSATGSLGPWSTITSLPQPDYEFGAAIENGWIYLTGGFNSNSNSLHAPFAAGTLGPYTGATLLPGPRQRHVSAATGGYVYIAGGEPTFSTNNLATAYRAQIQGDASLGAWSALPDMPSALGYSAVATLAGRIYVVGGSEDTGQVPKVYVLYPP